MYDLRSSRKRSRKPEQQEGTTPQDIPRVTDKGKGKLNPNSSKVKFSSYKEYNSSEVHTEEKEPILIKNTSDKEREAELGDVEKGQPAFNL